MKAKDTITWSDDLGKATITNKIGQKYAHKLLQEHFKEMTNVKGYWTFWFDYTDEFAHHYTVDNPIFKTIKQLRRRP